MGPSPVSPLRETEEKRDALGRFVNAPGPGRPKKDRWFVQQVQAFLEERDPNDEERRIRLRRLLDAGYAKALSGDVSAMRALKEWGYGKETEWFGEEREITDRELERVAMVHGRSVEDVRRLAEERGIRVIAA